MDVEAHGRRLDYGTDPQQFVMVHRARDVGAEPAPAVILIHGGFWRDGYSLDLELPVHGSLLELGWTVVNVEYRRVGSGGGYPRTLDDVASAVDTVRTLNVDLTRVALVGHSAGGHLALWAAARADGVGIAAVVGQAAVTDLELASTLDLSRGAVHELMGGEPAALAEAYAAASPQALPVAPCPHLLVHGTADDVVPPLFSVNFADRVRRLGGDVDLRLVDGDGHFEHLDPASRSWGTALTWLTARLTDSLR